MSEQTDRADLWRERIIAQQASGQSICGWCRVNGCAEHAFYYWRRRLGMQPPGVPRGGSHDRRRLPEVGPMAFAEVIPAPIVTAPIGVPIVEPLSTQVILLRLGGERELVLPAAMDVEQIARLVRAIERPA